ncbi:Cobalt-zinc-cadmium resistance protein CzcA; Cation efflux system protein CusA [hydrothermal vent metagenome]|uniref:Cobalt-zinc-cadmium resistance protein CzcA Cation efflux system protein CusA n=1 Tax=hydrothermal vent metagenome TaxID=652676 RepID=A0A3B0YF10_9ZZZZ
MLDKIIEFSINNRLIIVLGLLATLFGAAMMIPNLKLDAFPDVTNVQVTINTEARGLASEEVEQLITYPIEAVMYSLPAIEEVRSISKTGLSVITVVFKEGTNINFARGLVFQKLAEAREKIPQGIGVPSIGPNTTGLGMIFQYTVRSKVKGQYSAMQLRSINDWIVKLALMPEEGVTEVLSFGGQVKQYQVLLNPEALISYKVDTKLIISKIEENNRNAGGWYMDRGAEQLVIRGVGWVRSDKKGILDIGNIPIKTQDGSVVRVKDVARVVLGPEIRQGAVTMTTKSKTGVTKAHGEVVAGVVLKRWGANTDATIKGIKRRIKNLQDSLPKGIILERFYDQAELANKAVATVQSALLTAFVLIIIILFLFLLNIRVTLLVLISIPISSAIALMFMSHWGISANLMTLGGLTIAIGMMVDGSVVIMDNIFNYLNKKNPEFSGENPVAATESGIKTKIQQACKEVGRPVFFAAMIVVIVFMPMFALEGVEGKMFKPMAISIVLAMLASLVVALVIVPALASFTFRRPIVQKDSSIFVPLEKGYRKLLTASLKGKFLVVIGVVSLFVGSMILVPLLGTEFVPELEEGTINVRVTLAPSSSLKTAIEVAKKLESKIIKFPEVTYTSSRVGRAEIGGDPEPVSNVEIFIGLKPVSEWTSAKNRFELQKQMAVVMNEHPGLLLNFSQPIATRVDELLSGVKAQLAIKLFGPDLKQLATLGKKIEGVVKGIKGAIGVSLEPIAGEAQLVIKPNRAVLARFGISVSEVMSMVANSIGGQAAGQVISGNERYNIYVRLDQQYRNNISSIKRLILLSPRGERVQLGQLATVSIEEGPPQIRRDNVQRRVVIQANVNGRDMGGFVAEIKKELKQKITFPLGYYTEYGGQFKNQERALKRLSIVVPISLGLIFLLLYFAFNSVGQAMLIMINVPLALIGGIVSLYLSGQYLSVPGSIGFITLFGVAVLNGVVLVNAINQRLVPGEGLYDAIFEGALSRLRPVLMTALTTVLGLIPMLFATGVGSEVQRPLATVVVGGMFTATFLTLVVLPVLYKVFSGAILKKHGIGQ